MRFGIRLGTFWVSTSTRRRRRRKEPRRAESYHAVFRDENGKEQRCQHNHRTLEAAEQCAARENRKRQVENHKRTEAASLAQVHENQDRWRQVLEAVGPPARRAGLKATARCSTSPVSLVAPAWCCGAGSAARRCRPGKPGTRHDVCRHTRGPGRGSTRPRGNLPAVRPWCRQAGALFLMAFRAVHAQWGTVFAHLPDLGCGQTWEAVWKVRPPAPLTCDECHHPMHAKTSRNGLRFFAHAPAAPTCALALETLAHHMLKLELANAARDAGAHAEMEARGPDGTWRADVLASDPGGTWHMALEAQLAPIAAADITARTERMRADGIPSIWFSDRPRPPWLGVVPSARLTRPDDGQHLVIAEGLVKFDGYWQAVPATLVEFLGWAFAERIVAHRPRFVALDGLATVWTAPRYIRASDEDFAKLELEVEQDRRSRATQERRERDRAWQERQLRQVVHALKTGHRFPAGTWGAVWTSELWPLRKDIPAVRAIWAAAIEDSGGRLPSVAGCQAGAPEIRAGEGWCGAGSAGCMRRT